MSAKHFLERASWTLVDQCVVSGGNFLVNVLLARQLSEDDYGEFALFLGGIFLLRAVDYSFISYPLSVRLCVANGSERPRLLGNSAVLTAGLSLVLVLSVALGTILLDEENILLPACLCYLCWQGQETSRRMLLADFRYRDAIAGDGVAYIAQVLLIAALWRTNAVTLVAALYAMSASFALGALVHASKLQFARPAFCELRDLAREYFLVGKWSLVSYELALIRGQLFPGLLAAFAGPAATASLQAGLNIANMMNPIVFGIGNAIPQVAAHAHRDEGVLGATRAASRYVLFGLGPILVICGAAVVMPDLLLRMAYGPSSPYLAVALALSVLAVAGALDYVAEMISKTLLGVQAGRPAFLVNVLAAAFALALALALIGPLGVFGACLALLAANLVRVICAAIALAWLIGLERAKAPLPVAAKSGAPAAE